MKKTIVTSLALSSTFALAAFTGAAQAGTNPFNSADLPAGYQVADAHAKTGEGKCGEGKCGNTSEKSEEGKCGEGKCGEGKCGAEGEKASEGKCGEGKCGGGEG